MKNLVSVIVPSFKLADYLSATIESVIHQTYHHWECLIINDESPDHTEEIAKYYINKDVRFSYHFKRNGGSASSRKLGFELAKGNLILFLDGDDLIAPNFLEKMVKPFETIDKLDIAVCNYKVLDDRYQTYKANQSEMKLENFTYDRMLLMWDKTFAFPTHCCLYNIRLFKDYSFNTSLKSKEDWVMALQIFKKAKQIEFINEELATYRFRIDSKMKSKNYLKNLSLTFSYLMQEEVGSALRDPFFNKVNDFWIEKVVEKETFIHTILNSTKFRIGDTLTAPFLKAYKFFRKQ